MEVGQPVVLVQLDLPEEAAVELHSWKEMVVVQVQDEVSALGDC